MVDRFEVKKINFRGTEEKRKFAIGSETTVYVDTETGVQYLCVWKDRGAGLTLLVDREGKPLIDEKYR
ncbi:MAG: DUF6440 family protein [Oscillospiraceae bacterium]|nr:DUF6440 family protein [Oscillospiraceae bacterium]